MKRFVRFQNISIFAFLKLRDGRVVECGGLENHCAAMYRGSNPLLRIKVLAFLLGLFNYYNYFFFMKKIELDITKAATLEGNSIHRKLIFKHVLENIFARSWQFITDDHNLKENKSAVPFQFLGDLVPEPLFFINNNDKISCFSNVCTHRGNILITQLFVLLKKMLCADIMVGGLMFVVNLNICLKLKVWRDFPSLNDDLTQIEVGKWKQFLFSSLEPGFQFSDLIKDIEERVGWMPIEDFKYREDLSREYFVDANWALYCDNYLEGFHIPFIHEDLNAVLDFNSYDVEIFKYANLQIGFASDGEIVLNYLKVQKIMEKKSLPTIFGCFQT